MPTARETSGHRGRPGIVGSSARAHQVAWLSGAAFTLASTSSAVVASRSRQSRAAVSVVGWDA